LDPPLLYVPPAWALGAVPLDDLAEICPFRLYETFSGVFDAGSRRVIRIPMLGYEADQVLRVPVIRGWNAANRRWARRQRLLRIGIHPRDPELRLHQDLCRDLARFPANRDYASLCGDRRPQVRS
ncbi:MAG: DUF2334 domain-containing protein, partial [Thiohalocapsa sp.]